jgi:hypothetical protein
MLLDSVTREADPTWLDTLKESVSLHPTFYSQDASLKLVSIRKAMIHYVTLPWKFALALILPPINIL